MSYYQPSNLNISVIHVQRAKRRATSGTLIEVPILYKCYIRVTVQKVKVTVSMCFSSKVFYFSPRLWQFELVGCCFLLSRFSLPTNRTK